MTQVILEMHVLIASNFRPHRLTKRKSLVNQVKFLGLAYNFAAVELNLAMIKKFLQPTHALTDSRMEMNKCYCCKESATKIITNLFFYFYI